MDRNILYMCYVDYILLQYNGPRTTETTELR
jgi:hypothetical protein